MHRTRVAASLTVLAASLTVLAASLTVLAALLIVLGGKIPFRVGRELGRAAFRAERMHRSAMLDFSGGMLRVYGHPADGISRHRAPR
jgi:hypothetical protein